MHYEFYDVAMNLPSAECVTKVQYDDAYHANMRIHNATKVQLEVLEKIEDSPSYNTARVSIHLLRCLCPR